jgi:hypothetical protein
MIAKQLALIMLAGAVAFAGVTDGTVKSDSEIEAIFTWVSKDFHSTHKETCALKRKKAP